MRDQLTEKISYIGSINTKQAFKIILAVLILIGIVMVYSSSYMYAKEVMGSSIYFFIRQIVFSFLGLALGYLISKTRFQFWFKHSYKINLFVTTLVLLTFIPGVGVTIKGSCRWIAFGGFSIQPAEFVKYSLLLASINYFEHFFSYNRNKKIINLLYLLTPMILLLKQPDFGTFSIGLFIMAFVCYMSDFPRKWLYGLISVASVLAIILVFAASYRVQRVMTFLDPWKDPQNSGFQIIQSYLAFANGSILGQGIGNSNEKLFYLPEAYNDFIFSVIGEELGFIGVALVILLFMAFILFGFRFALSVKDRKSATTMIAIIVAIGLQALLNMCVVLGLLPTKGLNLPFISYGGSSLIANLGAIGLLFSAKNSANRSGTNNSN